MRAAWYERLGAARDVLRVGEQPVPEPGPGEVRVRLITSGVNPSDVKRRSGYRTFTMEYPLVIPHSDGAGVIDAVGPGVPEGRIGERVWTYTAQRGRPFGTAAEYVAVPEDRVVPLPVTTDFAEGACLGIPAVTAHACLFADGPIAGQHVLVTGGAGAVGHYAVQLAKWGGATVLATVSSDEKAAVARAAGADHVINYRSEDTAARVLALTGGAGVDRVVDVAFGANLAVTQRVIKVNGVVSVYGSDAVPEPAVNVYGFMSRNVTVHFLLMYLLRPEVVRAAHRDIVALLAKGALRHQIGRRYPLEEIAAAHEAMEGGAVTGNIVIDIAPEPASR